MEIVDEVFGSLQRTRDHFTGAVGFFPGGSLSIFIESDLAQPSDEDLLDAIECAKSIFKRLSPQFEAEVRAQAAEEVIDAVYSQSEEDAAPDAVHQLANEMTLEELDFHPGSAQFIWAAKNSFPGQSITAQIDEDLDIEEVMIQDELGTL